MLSRYSRAGHFSKRCALFFFLLTPMAAAQAPMRVVIPHASQVALRQTGVHTHANFLLFGTGPHDLQAMQRDPATYPHLTLKAHSRLPTDRAALPPDLAAFQSPGDPPLENPYGAIDGGAGKPGWSLLPGHQNRKNTVKVLVPTRFVNWLAAQPPARRRQYLRPQNYSLSIAWEAPAR